jgi:serine protease
MFRIRRGATASIAAGCGIALAALFAGAPSGVAAAQPTGPQAAAPQADVQAGNVHLVRSHGHVYRVEVHGRHGVIPMRGARGDAVRKQVGRAPADSTLIYNGGPVQHQVSVYLVFWGNQWDSDSNGVQQYQTNLFNGLGTSSDSWSTVTSQYTDNSGQGPSFGGSVLGGTWVDDSAPAPANAQQTDIAAEADAAASHFGVSGPDVQIVVMSPSGTSPDGFPNSGFCAWHDYDGTVSYTNMPYVLDAGSGCGANSVANQLDGFSIVGGHEYAESLTDPQPSSGWVASDGEENGDLCAWQNLGTVSLSTGDFAMQPTWSNAAGGCAMSG